MGGRHVGCLSAHQIASSNASLIRDGVHGHPPQHCAPVGDFGVLLGIGETAAGAKDNDLRDVAVVHPASQPITVKPFARDEFDENHRQASKAIHGMSIAQAGLFRKFAELLLKTHGNQFHREDDENVCYGHQANDHPNRVPLAPDRDGHPVTVHGPDRAIARRNSEGQVLRKGVTKQSLFRAQRSYKPSSRCSSTMGITIIYIHLAQFEVVTDPL